MCSGGWAAGPEVPWREIDQGMRSMRSGKWMWEPERGVEDYEVSKLLVLYPDGMQAAPSAKSRFARKDWRLEAWMAGVSNRHNCLHSDHEIA